MDHPMICVLYFLLYCSHYRKMNFYNIFSNPNYYIARYLTVSLCLCTHENAHSNDGFLTQTLICILKRHFICFFVHCAVTLSVTRLVEVRWDSTEKSHLCAPCVLIERYTRIKIFYIFNYKTKNTNTARTVTTSSLLLCGKCVYFPFAGVKCAAIRHEKWKKKLIASPRRIDSQPTILTPAVRIWEKVNKYGFRVVMWCPQIAQIYIQCMV